jgi:hypothetical protein
MGAIVEHAVRAAVEGNPGRLIGPETAPLAVEAGQVIFGEPDVRFTELVSLLLETIARLRTGGSPGRHPVRFQNPFAGSTGPFQDAVTASVDARV